MFLGELWLRAPDLGAIHGGFFPTESDLVSPVTRCNDRIPSVSFFDSVGRLNWHCFVRRSFGL
jgi:hypothetical protein